MTTQTISAPVAEVVAAAHRMHPEYQAALDKLEDDLKPRRAALECRRAGIVTGQLMTAWFAEAAEHCLLEKEDSR